MGRGAKRTEINAWMAISLAIEIAIRALLHEQSQSADLLGQTHPSVA